MGVQVRTGATEHSEDLLAGREVARRRICDRCGSEGGRGRGIDADARAVLDDEPVVASMKESFLKREVGLQLGVDLAGSHVSVDACSTPKKDLQPYLQRQPAIRLQLVAHVPGAQVFCKS